MTNFHVTDDFKAYISLRSANNVLIVAIKAPERKFEH